MDKRKQWTKDGAFRDTTSNWVDLDQVDLDQGIKTSIRKYLNDYSFKKFTWFETIMNEFFRRENYVFIRRC